MPSARRRCETRSPIGTTPGSCMAYAVATFAIAAGTWHQKGSRGASAYSQPPTEDDAASEICAAARTRPSQRMYSPRATDTYRRALFAPDVKDIPMPARISAAVIAANVVPVAYTT